MFGRQTYHMSVFRVIASKLTVSGAERRGTPEEKNGYGHEKLTFN